MRFKSTLKILLAAVVIAACAAVASAQTTQVEGTVKLKQADGTEAPVAGAQVDIYRTDIKSDFHVKTDKKGHYLHAGLPFVGTYTIIVSAPGAQPAWASGLRFTQVQEKDFTLSPGDGSTLTLDKVKALEAGGGGPRTGGTPPAAESKEAKAAREELERKNAEIQKKNEEITKGNEAVSRTFKAGNDAMAAGRIDEAIASYQEGLAVRPEETALLIRLSEAYRMRGVNRFNAAIKATDNDAKTQGIEAAKKDWTDSAASADKALAAANAVTPTAENQATVAQNKLAAITVRALALHFVATKVDQTQAQAAWDAYQAMIAAETDPAKKAKDRSEALQTLFDANALDLAIAKSREVLAENPDDVDANRILGLALISNNTTNDKAKFQEASNYLQHYVDKAPDSDPLKASTKEALDYLKTNENVKPEKTTTRQPARRH
ncbi:MAG TPA: carboxypeptidase-like regulatory domain-containing protein [Pyrinomonadaceae bacterium]|nr:carboxypeptidase-like regulatory domain-containing protein [Pyrinomonadaceae bacterium]